VTRVPEGCMLQHVNSAGLIREAYTGELKVNGMWVTDHPWSHVEGGTGV
jgi:hypothetical protein